MSITPETTLGELRERERQQTMDDYYATSLAPVNRLLSLLGQPELEYRMTSR